MVFDGAGGSGSNFRQTLDGSAPESGPDVWDLHWAPGAYGGGIIGQGSGHGAGNLFYFLPDPTALYGSVRIRFDRNYEFHPISNKFIFLEPDGALVQLNEDGKWLHGEVLEAGIWLDPANTDTPRSVVIDTWKNDAVTVDDWHQIEFLVDRSAGTFSIWLDGDLKTSARHIHFPNPAFTTFDLTGFRGGGGETLDHDMYWTYDHVFIAWP